MSYGIFCVNLCVLRQIMVIKPVVFRSITRNNAGTQRFHFVVEIDDQK